VYDDVRLAYETSDWDRFFDLFYAWITQYNIEDPYSRVSHIAGRDKQAKTNNSEGKIILANISKEYKGPAQTLSATDKTDRIKMIEAFIKDSLQRKRDGERVKKGDTIYVGSKLQFFYCLGRSQDKVTAIPLEELDKGLAKSVFTEDDVYAVPNPPSDQFPVLKELTDKHGVEWILGDKYSREDKEGKSVEGSVIAIYPEYKTSKGALVNLVILETERKLTALAPDLNSFKTTNLNKGVKDGEVSAE
jgi:hypothetical protein